MSAVVIKSPRGSDRPSDDDEEYGGYPRQRMRGKKSNNFRSSKPSKSQRVGDQARERAATDPGGTQYATSLSGGLLQELTEREQKLQAEIESRKKALSQASIMQQQHFEKLQETRKAELNSIRKQNNEQLRQHWAKAEQESASERTQVDAAVLELRAQDTSAVKKAIDRAAQAQEDLEELKEKLLEERQLQKQIREDCEWRIQEMRLEMSMEVMRVRRDAAAEAENVLTEARRLVDTASSRLDEQRRRLLAANRDSVASVELIVAGKESEVSSGVRRVVEEYWRQASQANQNVEAETRSLQQLCAELEEATMSQREDLQARARREAESKIDAHKRRKRALLAQMEAQQWQHDAAVAEVMQKVESDCRKFENACRRRACLQISVHRRAAQRTGGPQSPGGNLSPQKAGASGQVNSSQGSLMPPQITVSRLSAGSSPGDTKGIKFEDEAKVGGKRTSEADQKRESSQPSDQKMASNQPPELNKLKEKSESRAEDTKSTGK